MAVNKSILWKITYNVNRTKWDAETSAYLADSGSVQSGPAGIIIFIISAILAWLKMPTPIIIALLIIGFLMLVVAAISSEYLSSRFEKNRTSTLEKAATRKKSKIDSIEKNKISREIAEKILLRDADQQSYPYTYEIGRHGNETLALRYGIANIINNTGEASSRIRVQKIRKAGMLLDSGDKETVENNCYLVKLSDFRNREALAIIEPGTEYVKTFYPIKKSWFENNSHLESTLKGNYTMSLKEVATFHILKSIN